MRSRLVALALAVVLSASARPAPAVEIWLFQRGYIEGGTGDATTLTDAAVAAFEENNPDIDVHVVGVPWGKEGDLKLRTALLARRRIDVFRVAHDQLTAFVPREGRLLAPVGGELTPADREAFGEQALRAVTVNGEVLAWPLWSTALVLVVNLDLLEQAGVTPPEESAAWTWTEFERALQAVETLRQSGATRAYAFNAAARPPLMEWAPLLMAQCGPLFPEEGTAGDAAKEIALAPRLADALARVADLRRRGLTAPTFGIDDAPAAQESFLSGNVAMLMTSPALLRRLETARFRWRIVAPPVGEWGEPITTGALAAFAVVDSGDAERITAAHRLARYLTSEAVARDVPGWYLAPPARRTIDTFYDMPPYDALQPVLPLASYLRPPSRPGFMEGVFVPQLQAGLMDEATPGGGRRRDPPRLAPGGTVVAGFLLLNR